MASLPVEMGGVCEHPIIQTALFNQLNSGFKSLSKNIFLGISLGTKKKNQFCFIYVYVFGKCWYLYSILHIY